MDLHVVPEIFDKLNCKNRKWLREDIKNFLEFSLHIGEDGFH